MNKRTSLRQASLIFSIIAMGLPSLGYGQSQGPGGADSSYHSGSAATGHHGTSGSAKDPRNEPGNSTNTLPAGDDQAMTQRIRQALRADEGLIPYAEGIYIGANGGRVTLRGPVKTEKDKADISATVQSVAGVREIDNQLQVAPNLSGTTGGSTIPK